MVFENIVMPRHGPDQRIRRGHGREYLNQCRRRFGGGHSVSWRKLGLSFLGGSDDPFARCRSAAIAGGEGSIGGPFTLVSSNSEAVTDKDVVTKPSPV